MTSSELRAGNLITIEDLVVQVRDVCNSEKAVTAITPDEREITRKVSEVKPISLADGPLNQYCDVDEYDNIIVGIDKHLYYLQIKEGYTVLLSQNYEPLIHFWDVRYVHQLQNLYHALKGQDMKVAFGETT